MLLPHCLDGLSSYQLLLDNDNELLSDNDIASKTFLYVPFSDLKIIKTLICEFLDRFFKKTVL